MAAEKTKGVMFLLQEKEQKLEHILRGLGRVLIAFSGGVDSTLLSMAAFRVLGGQAVAVHILSPFSSHSDKQDVRDYAKKIGIPLVFLETNELADSEITVNSPRRCYFCKKIRMAQLSAYAEENGFSWILDGSNQDDLGDFRPGMQALQECEIARSPLLEAGFTKPDVRLLSREWGLDSWDKPAAACLASRIPYGEPITAEALARVDTAESSLRPFIPRSAQLRVRLHGDLARIEVDPAGIALLLAHSQEVTAELKKQGFRYVTLDLEGYHMGSFNP